MKILHTADWHLGKKLEQCERTEEHQYFIDWLIKKLTDECIDVLIIAGDIFDSGTPSNIALQQYYRFLREVKNTCCREVIIIGGNHDSISTLNAPRELLKYFNVHIIGGVPDNFTDQIIPINNLKGSQELIICAVPFLRDKDIRLSITGETSAERETRIRHGINEHYNRFLEHIEPYISRGIPVVATGHLFAAGASTSDSEKEIHVGNLGQVGQEIFPKDFSYIALGHLHRPQTVNKTGHIRYSGSPIPLSFSETEDKKQVVVLEFQNGVLTRLEEHEVPCCRKLIRLKGRLETIRSKILLLSDPQLPYPAWVEVQVETESNIYDLEEQLNKLILNKTFIERLFVRQTSIRNLQPLDQIEEAIQLTDLTPKEVFMKRCEAEFGDFDYSDLIETFNEVLEKISQKES